jgi:phage-related protein
VPKVVLFREANGKTPLLTWLDGRSKKVRDHYYVSIDRLRQLGHELRRPEADYLADGIYELRFRCERLNYRIFYFFRGREVIVLSHGILKQGSRVPVRDLDLALRRRLEFLANPERHTHPGGNA